MVNIDTNKRIVFLICNEDNCKIENQIEEDGAHLLYGSLLYNSTLTSLNTGCKWIRNKSMAIIRYLPMHWETVEEIEFDSPLSSLNLSGNEGQSICFQDI